MNVKQIKVMYMIAGLYDGILGLAFLFFPTQIFEYYNVTPPNHLAYVQFPAMLLVIFAFMFFLVASDPVKYKLYIPAGCGLKISYCSMAFWYKMTSGVPNMWMPWAWADAVFLLLFIYTWTQLGGGHQNENTPSESDNVV